MCPGFAAVFGLDTELGWIIGMLAIPGATAWFIALGVILLRRRFREAPPVIAVEAAVA